MKYKCTLLLSFCFLFIVQRGRAQDLDPRAYVWIPVHITGIGAGYGYTYGGVVTDPTLPLKDVDAKISTVSLGGSHVFSLFHQTAQVSVTIPFAWAEVSGSVFETAQSVTRSGFCDSRLRLSYLFMGGPAATPAEIVKAPRRTILGTSLSVIVPTGQYINGKLINLGTNRWAFKPELALSQPIGKRWLVDVYAGMWFFTANNSFYPGSSKKSQDPMGTFQAHISYNVTPLLWLALDMTFYAGGASTIDGAGKDDRQENSRIGGTLVLPVGKRHSIKVAYSTGAIIRFGGNFSTISIGWNAYFLRKPKKS